MGTPYLLDTNVIIYFLDAKLPDSALDDIESKLNEFGSIMSVISKIELLGWQAPSSDAMLQIINFVNDSAVVPLSDEIVDKTIEIKRLLKIKLPDAVIAATALIHDYTLISRNESDFKKIDGLKFLNPFAEV